MYFLIIVAIFSLALGTYVLVKGINKILNRSFFWLSIFSTLWILTNVFAGLMKTIFWIKSAYAFGAFVPAAALMWVLYLSGSKLKKYYVYSIGFLGLFFFVLPYIDGLVLSKIEEVFLGGFVGKFGPLFPLYAFYQMIMFLSMWLVSYVAYKNSAIGLKREQFKYVFMGVVLTCLLIFIVSFLLPLFGIIRFTFLDSPSLVIFLSFITYTITRFRLFNIKYVITRSILYTALIGTVASFFAFFIFWLAPKVGGDTNKGRIISTILSSILIVVFLDPIKKFFARITDNIFYKDRIDYQKVSQNASSVVAREIDLEKLSNSLSNLLASELKIKEVSILIAKDKNFIFISNSQRASNSFELGQDFVSFIKEKKDFIIIEELIRTQGDIGSEVPYYKQLEKFIKEAENFGIEMVVPIMGDNNIVTAIFLFSAKSSGDLYSQDDINFLKILTPQIATAIEKSKLYEEVQALNRELQAKVDAKTKSLKQANVGLEQRNKFLTAMQAVTNKVGRTMDLKQINQMIANSIYSEFGYVGGVLSFVDERTNVLRIGAITESEQTKLVVQILGQDPKKFEAKLEVGYSLGVKTVLSGTRNDSDKMSDFFSPPVDKLVMDKVQEALGVKAIVGFPIFSEDKIIGIIHFLLAVEKSKVTSLDLDTMTALTSQVGIVSRNLRLYNNLQTTNQDLQIANMRLRELDQAKSEFLSIASHQLRTPISALKGYLSMISDGDFGVVPPKISKVVKDLFESAARLARLVNIFLNVSRIESGRLKIEKKPLQIGDMIESVIAELHNESDKKGVKLIYKKPKPALPLVAADADKLREVVLNLIDNSIKYTPKGQIEVGAFIEGENFHFQVQDTGIGIDPEEAKNLFRKFVRASGAAQIHTGGSGLGLFIAQKIIKEHGGKIWVESAGKEKGSTFQFVIALKGAEPNTEEMKA